MDEKHTHGWIHSVNKSLTVPKWRRTRVGCLKNHAHFHNKTGASLSLRCATIGFFDKPKNKMVQPKIKWEWGNKMLWHQVNPRMTRNVIHRHDDKCILQNKPFLSSIWVIWYSIWYSSFVTFLQMSFLFCRRRSSRVEVHAFSFSDNSYLAL